MAASVQTNWLKASQISSFWQNTDCEGNAIPSTFYVILLPSTFPGFSGNDTDPDITLASQLTGALNPSLYTGNSVARSSVGFTTTQDNGNNRGYVNFTTPPTLTATGTVSDVKGYAVVTANNLTTARVAAIERFANGPFSLSATQTLTINGANMIVT